jgi:glycosyltransferase involved in cell wall biosynthesis
MERADAVMKEIGQPYEIILVNDCSPDDVTWKTIVSLSDRYENLVGLNLLYNVGQYKAILCGFAHARGKYIITMDDDLQHPPEEIKTLVETMHERKHLLCIIGKYKGKKHSFIRNLGSLAYEKMMMFLYKVPSGLALTSFRILTRELAETLLQCPTTKPVIGFLIVRVTNKIANVEVRHNAREQGKSGYNLINLMHQFLDCVLYASMVPLQLFSGIGFLTSFSAFLCAIIYFIQWMLGQISSPGYTSLILTISFFSGMILFGIGVLGEYIGRIVSEQVPTPRFYVQEKITRSPSLQ